MNRHRWSRWTGLRAAMVVSAALVVTGCASGTVSVGFGTSYGYGYGYGYGGWQSDPWYRPPTAALPAPLPIRPLPGHRPVPLPAAMPGPRLR